MALYRRRKVLHMCNVSRYTGDSAIQLGGARGLAETYWKEMADLL